MFQKIAVQDNTPDHFAVVYWSAEQYYTLAVEKGQVFLYCFKICENNSRTIQYSCEIKLMQLIEHLTEIICKL